MGERKRVKGNINDIFPEYKQNTTLYWIKQLKKNQGDEETQSKLKSIVGLSRMYILKYLGLI